MLPTGCSTWIESCWVMVSTNDEPTLLYVGALGRTEDEGESLTVNPPDREVERRGSGFARCRDSLSVLLRWSAPKPLDFSESLLLVRPVLGWRERLMSWTVSSSSSSWPSFSLLRPLSALMLTLGGRGFVRFAEGQVKVSNELEVVLGWSKNHVTFFLSQLRLF